MFDFFSERMIRLGGQRRPAGYMDGGSLFLVFVSGSRECRRPVFHHIDASAHGIAADFPGEGERQVVAGGPVTVAQLDLGAFYRSRDILGGEKPGESSRAVALLRACALELSSG